MQSARGLLWSAWSVAGSWHGVKSQCKRFCPSGEAFTVHLHVWTKRVGSVFVFMNNKKKHFFFQFCYLLLLSLMTQGVKSPRLNKYTNVWNLSLVEYLWKYITLSYEIKQSVLINPVLFSVFPSWCFSHRPIFLDSSSDYLSLLYDDDFVRGVKQIKFNCMITPLIPVYGDMLVNTGVCVCQVERMPPRGPQ